MVAIFNLLLGVGL